MSLLVMQILTSLLALLVTCAVAATNQTLVFSWVKVDYDWPNESVKDDYITSEKYVVENNVITGIKVYKDDVYVTVPRWRHGVPSTLNRVVMKDGSPVLQPYPSWEDNREGDCNGLQYTQSMEVDANTGLMWIIDNGRVNFFDTTPAKNTCPPKLVIYDMDRKRYVHRYTFPDHVANRSSCFLNDIVLDYVGGKVRFAYITDTSDAKLYVYDYARDTSYYFQDPSMRPDPSVGTGVTPLDGIAMSSSFDYVYYCPLDSARLFQIPTAVLRDRHAHFGNHVRCVGTRLSRSDGLAYGRRSLYYGLLDKSGVQMWLVAHDASQTPGGYAGVNVTTEEDLARDVLMMKWVDTFAWDEAGHLWFVANDLSRFLNGSMDFSGGSGRNMHVWRLFVDDASYLSKAIENTASGGQGLILARSAGSGADVLFLAFFLFIFVV